MPEPRERPTLLEGLRGSDNAFGVIRLVLASAVIFSHAFYLGGWSEDPTHRWTHGQETIGGFAVVGFFLVSGYLITKSGMRTDIMQFLWHRALRIFPAFLVVLLVAAVVVGPWVWHDMGRDASTYWTGANGGPITYLTHNAGLDIRQWGVHDIFATTTPYGDIVGGSVFNGSLWTLAYEWRAYLVIGLFVALGILRRSPRVVLAATAVAYAIGVIEFIKPGAAAALWPAMSDHQSVRLTLAFLIGSAFAALADRIRLYGWVAIAGGVVAVASLATQGWMIVGYPALGYVLMYAAARLPGWWRRIGAVHDYSYGMYVYGFLVQQFTAYLGWHRWGYLPWVAATLAVTAVCAVISWHGVERWALALKKWGPGRGLPWLAGAARRRSPQRASATT